LHFPPFQGNPGQLTIWVGKEAQDYEIRRLATDWGVGFSMTKLSVAGPTATYHCCLNAENAQDVEGLCDCLGREHTGSCKHLRVLQRLLERGDLRASDEPDPAPAAADDEEAPF
jgi:hypothetical protein